jgi:hypothetical protein
VFVGDRAVNAEIHFKGLIIHILIFLRIYFKSIDNLNLIFIVNFQVGEVIIYDNHLFIINLNFKNFLKKTYYRLKDYIIF